MYLAIAAVMTATDRAPSRFSWSVKNRPSMRRIPITEKNDGSTALNWGRTLLENVPVQRSLPGTFKGKLTKDRIGMFSTSTVDSTCGNRVSRP